MGKDNFGTLNPQRHHQFLSAVTKSATVRGAKGEEGGGTHGEAVGRFSVGDRAPEGQRQRWDRWERGRSLSPFRLVGAAGSSRPRGVRSEAAISIDRSIYRGSFSSHPKRVSRFPRRPCGADSRAKYIFRMQLGSEDRIPQLFNRQAGILGFHNFEIVIIYFLFLIAPHVSLT